MADKYTVKNQRRPSGSNGSMAHGGGTDWTGPEGSNILDAKADPGRKAPSAGKGHKGAQNTTRR